jgi:hypothetical protein
LYKEFLQSIRSYDERKREQSEKIRRQLERRHRADQARVRRDLLQLAVTLRIFAVGSSRNHQDTFQETLLNEQKLNRNQRKSNVNTHAIAPVIFGRIDDTSSKIR